MSKAQHGNREAKKPKKAAAKPVLPGALAPLAMPVTPDKPKKR